VIVYCVLLPAINKSNSAADKNYLTKTFLTTKNAKNTKRGRNRTQRDLQRIDQETAAHGFPATMRNSCTLNLTTKNTKNTKNTKRGRNRKATYNEVAWKPAAFTNGWDFGHI
jgi:hypothetical protein